MGFHHAPSCLHTNTHADAHAMVVPPVRPYLRKHLARECEKCVGVCAYLFFSLGECSFRSFLTLRWTNTASEHKNTESNMKTKKRPSALELHDGWAGGFWDGRVNGVKYKGKANADGRSVGHSILWAKTRQRHVFACTQKGGIMDGWPRVLLTHGLEGKGGKRRERDGEWGVQLKWCIVIERTDVKTKGHMKKEEGKPMVTL